MSPTELTRYRDRVTKLLEAGWEESDLAAVIGYETVAGLRRSLSKVAPRQDKVDAVASLWHGQDPAAKVAARSIPERPAAALRLRFSILVTVEVGADDLETVQETIDRGREYGEAAIIDVETIRKEGE